MADATGLQVAHSVGPIFVIFKCLGRHLVNDIMNVVFLMVNCLWMVDITLFFNGSLHEMVQWCSAD